MVAPQVDPDIAPAPTVKVVAFAKLLLVPVAPHEHTMDGSAGFPVRRAIVSVDVLFGFVAWPGAIVSRRPLAPWEI